MSDKNWYKEWFNSPFYHKLYFERDENEAAVFIDKLIQHLNPAPGSRILDVACGRGRHSRLLADKGFQVTGIDIAPDSIAFAWQYENDNLEFFVNDMRLLFRGNYFDYAFNFFTSFGYFNTRREHEDAIRTIATSLKPGGFFVFDYLNVHYAEDNMQHEEIKPIGDTIYEIHRWDDDSHFYKKMIITDPSLKEPLVFTEKVSKFSLGDFNDMLSYYGFRIQEVFGDYNLSHYDVRKTPRLILVAQKAVNDKGGQEKRIYSDGRSNDPLTQP